MRETDFHIGMQTSILIEGKENEEKTGIRDGRLTTRRVQISAENISFFSFFFFLIFQLREKLTFQTKLAKYPTAGVRLITPAVKKFTTCEGNLTDANMFQTRKHRPLRLGVGRLYVVQLSTAAYSRNIAGIISRKRVGGNSR